MNLLDAIRELEVKDYPRFIKRKMKAYSVEMLPKAISRALNGSYIGSVEWTHYRTLASGLVVPVMSAVDYNFLSDQGEQDVLETFYVNQSAPAGNFFLGLSNSTPVDTSTLATITEVSGSGYARQTIQRNTTGWPTRGLVGNDWQIQALTVTFTATGTWTTANYAFLASVVSGTSGRFWNYVLLSVARTLGNGDSLQFTYKITLQ